MNKEERKEIILKDLCARVPYNLKVRYQNKDYEVIGIINNGTVYTNASDGGFCPLPIDKIKPYLRSMSSMTDEEKSIYVKIYNELGIVESMDMLNSLHLDYRDFISKGLALEANEEMY